MTTRKPDAQRRPARVSERIREVIAELLTRDLKDPRLEGVVLSAVESSEDLSIATVFLVVLNDDAKRTRARAARSLLTKMEGGLRKRIAPHLGVRRTPELRFEVDTGREEVERLDALLAEVSLELKNSPATRGEGESGR